MDSCNGVPVLHSSFAWWALVPTPWSEFWYIEDFPLPIKSPCMFFFGFPVMWFSGGSHAAFYTNCFEHSTMGLWQFWDTHWQGSAKQQKLVGSHQCVFHLFYHHLNIWSQRVFKTQTVHIGLYLIPFTWHVYEKISRYTKFWKNVCSLYL